jgi:hypothetical protein
MGRRCWAEPVRQEMHQLWILGQSQQHQNIGVMIGASERRDTIQPASLHERNLSGSGTKAAKAASKIVMNSEPLKSRECLVIFEVGSEAKTKSFMHTVKVLTI